MSMIRYLLSHGSNPYLISSTNICAFDVALCLHHYDALDAYLLCPFDAKRMNCDISQFFQVRVLADDCDPLMMRPLIGSYDDGYRNSEENDLWIPGLSPLQIALLFERKDVFLKMSSLINNSGFFVDWHTLYFPYHSMSVGSFDVNLGALRLLYYKMYQSFHTI